MPMDLHQRNCRGGVCVLLLLLGACVASPDKPPPPPTGEASWRQVLPDGMVRYELALGEVSSGAAAFKRVAPVYPPAQLASCPPPQEVEALLVVDRLGAVGQVRVADEARATAARHAFIDAVRTAALQWRFRPLRVERWAADADGDSHVVGSDTRPFSMAYVFRFACHAGQPAVSSEAAVPAG